MKKKTPEFHTSSFYEAAHLISKGFQLKKLEETDDNFVGIYFDDSKELREVVDGFCSNDPIPVLTFIHAYQRIKNQVFKFKNNEEVFGRQ